MKSFGRILFPAAVTAAVAAGVLGLGSEPMDNYGFPAFTEAQDTVTYPSNGYKLNRKGDLGEYVLADSLSKDDVWGEDSLTVEADTLPHLTARDTIKAPDSLKYTDPFRYKYYVALVDSLTHVQVRDSLKRSSDFFKTRADSFRTSIARFLSLTDSLLTAKDTEASREPARLAGIDSVHFRNDSLQAFLDSLDWRKIDSIYIADSTAIAKAEFERWYNSLSRKERRKYDIEQMIPIKMAEMDSLRKAKEDAQAIKDSIVENTPRILETFAIPDSLKYKRIIAWTVDPDFHRMDVAVPDTTYNYHFYDHPFLRKDVNANWLGVAGSPVQYYNWFNRRGTEGVEFYTAMEPWTSSIKDVLQYNSKTPYTELAYYGTLFSNKDKESDNIHIFTTQNITPAFNFNLLYDRYGGGGMLENEETKNKTAIVGLNYLGKRYLAHAGFIYNNATRGENGGINDRMWIRDTTVEFREIDVNLKNASSKVKKKTFYLEQQLSIPFNFINDIRERRDSIYGIERDSLDTFDVTTAFIGHTSEYSIFERKYTDKVGPTDMFARDFYNNIFLYDPSASNDTLNVNRLDNKFFLRLQPWSSDALISKLDVGVGDRLLQYFDSTTVRPQKHTENSVYMYAGAEGQLRDYIHWNAKGDYVFLGHDFGDFGVEADARLDLYPFRRAKKSPMSLGARFETTLRTPNYYQRVMNSNHFIWENEYSKVSTTRIEADLNIPHWGIQAKVGYALIANPVYYDTLGFSRQHDGAMSVLSASLRKDFVFGPLHLENKALIQVSSNQDVIPVPAAAFNLRWYFQFVPQWDEEHTHKVMEMQIGANAFYNTPWYSPTWNPNLGVFHNQNKELYTNGPYFDIFVNVQWKRACIFVKYQNAAQGWPMKKFDYFSSDGYVVTGPGMNGLKVGLYWPFYTQPGKSNPAAARAAAAGGSGSTDMSRPSGPSGGNSGNSNVKKAVK